MWLSISKTLKSKYFYWPVTLLAVIFISVLAFFGNIDDKVVTPNDRSFLFEAYTDSSNGGSSQIINQYISDSAFLLRFQLHEGFQSPYVGVKITPSNGIFFDLSRYNQLELTISGQNINRVGLALYTPSPINIGGQNDEALYHSYFDISNKKETLTIRLDKLKLPEWWEDKHQISESENNNADFSKVLHFTINTAFSLDLKKDKSIEIYSIRFTRNNTDLIFFLCISFLIIAIILLVFLSWNENLKNKKSQLTISYKAVDLPDSALTEKDHKKTCIDYINLNYNNCDLSIEIVAKNTGIAPRQITQIIHEKYNCNFKTYINRIRIHESKRLLKETDLGMGEIAFKVGFNTQSHFNRVFKIEINVSPSEFRGK